MSNKNTPIAAPSSALENLNAELENLQNPNNHDRAEDAGWFEAALLEADVFESVRHNHQRSNYRAS